MLFVSQGSSAIWFESMWRGHKVAPSMHGVRDIDPASSIAYSWGMLFVWNRGDLIAESSFRAERLGEELYELALREPLLPGFLHLLGLGAYTADLVDLGYQMATDVAYIKPER